MLMLVSYLSCLPVESCPVPSNCHYTLGKYWKYKSTNLNFENAIKNCQADGANLAIVKTEDEFNFAKSIKGQSITFYWDSNSSKSTWIIFQPMLAQATCGSAFTTQIETDALDPAALASSNGWTDHFMYINLIIKDRWPMMVIHVSGSDPRLTLMINPVAINGRVYAM